MKTRDTAVETNYWRGCAKPAAQFFLHQNPHYGDGNGLLTLVPLTASGLARAAGRALDERTRPHRETLRTRVFGKRTDPIGLPQIVRTLQGTQLFRPLDAWDLDHLSELMEVRRFRSGEPAIRAGEPGDAFYVVPSGPPTSWSITRVRSISSTT